MPPIPAPEPSLLRLQSVPSLPPRRSSCVQNTLRQRRRLSFFNSDRWWRSRKKGRRQRGRLVCPFTCQRSAIISQEFNAVNWTLKRLSELPTELLDFGGRKITFQPSQGNTAGSFDSMTKKMYALLQGE